MTKPGERIKVRTHFPDEDGPFFLDRTGDIVAAIDALRVVITVPVYDASGLGLLCLEEIDIRHILPCEGGSWIYHRRVNVA